VITYLKVDDVEPVSTAHGAGLKKVLSMGHADLTRLTQVAWGQLLQGDAIQPHKHPDMEECFFFLKGSGKMMINQEYFQLEPGIFLIVPPSTEHTLTCEGETLEFFYFGMQVY
jgi:mannose-6-phosphate isomerase-like protein (cupin superfamily)